MPGNPVATALCQALQRWRSAVDESAAHARLARFAPGRPGDAARVRLVLDVLSRGVSLLQAAGVARAGKSGLGEPWRLVMGYAGFELFARAVLDAHPRAELGREDFAALLDGCRLP